MKDLKRFENASVPALARRTVLLILLAASPLTLSGCAASDQAATDYDNTFQSTPAKPEDSHGWGEGFSGVSK